MGDVPQSGYGSGTPPAQSFDAFLSDTLKFTNVAQTRDVGAIGRNIRRLKSICDDPQHYLTPPVSKSFQDISKMSPDELHSYLETMLTDPRYQDIVATLEKDRVLSDPKKWGVPPQSADRIADWRGRERHPRRQSFMNGDPQVQDYCHDVMTRFNKVLDAFNGTPEGKQVQATIVCVEKAVFLAYQSCFQFTASIEQENPNNGTR